MNKALTEQPVRRAEKDGKRAELIGEIIDLRSDLRVVVANDISGWVILLCPSDVALKMEKHLRNGEELWYPFPLGCEDRIIRYRIRGFSWGCICPCPAQREIVHQIAEEFRAQLGLRDDSFIGEGI